MRAGQFNMRLSDIERERLDFVADHYGLSPAGALRMMVKHEWDKIRNSDWFQQREEMHKAVEKRRQRRTQANG